MPGIAMPKGTPEQQIRAGAQGSLDTLGAQEQNAIQQGDIAAQEADANAKMLEDRNVELQAQRMGNETKERERAQGLADRTTTYEKAVDAEANYKVDDGRRWKNLGTGSKILAGISLAMTGLGDALQGKSGPNIALQIINEAIRDDVAAQVRDRDQLGKVADRKRSSLDVYRQQTGDLRDAANLKIAEEYKRVADQMEATAAKYANPKAKLQAQNMAQSLRLQGYQLVGQTAQGSHDRDMQRQQLGISRGQLGVAQGNLSLANKQFKQGIKEFDKRMTLEEKKLLIDAAQADAAGNGAAAKAMRDEAALYREQGMLAPAQLEMGPDNKPLLHTDGPLAGTPIVRRDTYLKNQDNSVWVAPKEARPGLAKKMHAAEQITSLLDDAMALRDASGGESSAANSDNYQKLKVLQNRLIVLSKGGTEGMSSDEDMKKLADALGAGDLTSFRAKAAGLEAGRDYTVRELNSALKYQGNYSGPPIEFTSARAKGAATSTDDVEFKNTISKPSLSYDQAFEQASKAARDRYTEAAKADPEIARAKNDQFADPGGAKARLKAELAEAKTTAEEYKDITPDQRSTIQALGETAANAADPQAAMRARTRLAAIADKANGGQTETIRRLAADALIAATAHQARENVSGGRAAEVSSSSSARDTSYGAP